MERKKEMTKGEKESGRVKEGEQNTFTNSPSLSQAGPSEKCELFCCEREMRKKT